MEDFSSFVCFCLCCLALSCFVEKLKVWKDLMARKRPFCEECDDDGMQVPTLRPKRRPKFQNAVRDVMRGISLHEIASVLEPLIRKAVREEVERAVQLCLHSSQRSSFHRIEPYEARCWQLHFVNKLPPTLFTSSKIKTEDSAPPKVIIVDACSKNVITSGPLSSMKVEILVLDGDFGVDEQTDWTEQQFGACVVRERVGKRPLLTGELATTLKNGVGYFRNIAFTDNSSWRRNRKFRLGVKTVRSDFRIREARSDAFMVKDHRGESYKKHHPPSLGDEIWRLEKIAKHGVFHQRFASNEIHTVKDFLRLYYTNKSLLFRLLGGGTSTKVWETIIEHATACLIDDHKLYVYYGDAQRVGLLFNSVYSVVGAIFDGVHHSLDQLNPSQEISVEDLKHRAYKNVKDFMPIDDPSAFDSSRPLGSLQADLFTSTFGHDEYLDFPVANLGQQEALLSFNPSTSQEGDSQLDFSMAQTSHPNPALGSSSTMEDSLPGLYDEGNGWAPFVVHGECSLINHFPMNDTSHQAQSSSGQFPLLATTWGKGKDSFLASSGDGQVPSVSSLPNFTLHLSRCGKQKARWCKIRAAIKWGISVRRNAAAKRMPRILSLMG